MSDARSRVAELSDAELFDSEALKMFTINVRDLCRDMAWALDFQAEMLQANLSTVPVPAGRYGGLSSRIRARAVAWCLRQAADAMQHAGRLAVKCWSLYMKHYSPTTQQHVKPKFTV